MPPPTLPPGVYDTENKKPGLKDHFLSAASGAVAVGGTLMSAAVAAAVAAFCIFDAPDLIVSAFDLVPDGYVAGAVDTMTAVAGFSSTIGITAFGGMKSLKLADTVGKKAEKYSLPSAFKGAAAVGLAAVIASVGYLNHLDHVNLDNHGTQQNHTSISQTQYTGSRVVPPSAARPLSSPSLQ